MDDRQYSPDKYICEKEFFEKPAEAIGWLDEEPDRSLMRAINLTPLSPSFSFKKLMPGPFVD